MVPVSSPRWPPAEQGAMDAIGALADAMTRSGIDVVAMALAWARAMPAVLLVPAFGLRALPVSARAVMGLALAACALPATIPASPVAPSWGLLFAMELARGLPIALAAAIPLWAATMAGGAADALRGVGGAPRSPVVEDGATALGVPMSLLASAIFLATGGPARVAAALARRDSPGAHTWQVAADDVAGGVTIAVALGAPLLGATVVLEIAAALIARAASPLRIPAVVASLRAAATLVLAAVVFDRIAAAIAQAVEAAP